MVQFTFTGIGSLIHPILMLLIMPLWVITGILGVIVRQKRVTPPQGEESPMLQEDIRSISTEKRWHHKLSAALTFITYFLMLIGMYNTYLRSGRLFPSPHMYGGFWFTLLLTFQVALVPWFKTAIYLRVIHAVTGFSVTLLLINQIWSGIPLLKDIWSIVFN